MKTLYPVVIILLFLAAGSFFAGRSFRPTKTEVPPISGIVIPNIESEAPPDTVFVLVYAEPKDQKNGAHSDGQKDGAELTPLESIKSCEKRDEATFATLTDWNTKRAYSGILFSDKQVGTVTYGFDVQYNRAGEIRYHFQPAPVPKMRPKWGIGIQAGYGIPINGRPAPYIGVGVQYNLWTW